MSIAVASIRLPAIDWARLTLSVPLMVWCLVGVLIAGGYDFAADPGRLQTALGDTDDATRLVQVRQLQQTGAWFDRTLPNIGAPDPLVSHWSRLIDAPLAGMLTAFETAMPRAAAELITRALWPMLVLLALMAVLAETARARAGQLGALIAIGLAATAQSGLVQFAMGRIDHHNVMILGAVGGSLFLARSLANRRFGCWAGALLGLGTAIGYEGLALTVFALTLAALYAACKPEFFGAVVRAAWTFTAVLLAVFLLTVSPDAWSDIRCDALSANLVVLAAVGSAGLTACSLLEVRLNLAGRLATLSAFGIAGLGCYAALEPACLAGPFGQVDPAIIPIWLSQVQETQTIWQLAGEKPAAAMIALGFSLIGLLAALVNWRARPQADTAFGVIILAAAIALGCWHIKFGPYSAFLAVPPLAIMIASIGRVGEISAPTMRALAFVVLNQRTLAMLLLLAMPLQPQKAAAARQCFETRNVSDLAALSAGLIVADVDLGPFIAALTPHRVEVAPYHRLDRALIENHQIMHGDREQAAQKLRGLGAKYVVACGTIDPLANRGAADPSLRSVLFANTAPDFLQPIPMPPDNPLRVWRITP